MQIFTKWICYNGKVGVTENGEYFDIETGSIMNREVHAGAFYYRPRSSNKRFSYNKCNQSKILKRVEIIQFPF